jgi:hypothetical protein
MLKELGISETNRFILFVSDGDFSLAILHKVVAHTYLQLALRTILIRFLLMEKEM